MSKLDSSGNFIWAKAMGGIYGRGCGIAMDDAGNVYTTGDFGGTVDFDPRAGDFQPDRGGATVTSSCQSSTVPGIWFGPRLWAGYFMTMPMASRWMMRATSALRGISAERRISIQDRASFNLTSAGEEDIFVSKLDSAGDFIWAKAMGGTSGDWGSAIAVDDSGNVYTTGLFGFTSGGTADFNPGHGTFNLTSAGVWDIFVSKLDSAGGFVWAKSHGRGEWRRGFRHRG